MEQFININALYIHNLLLDSTSNNEYCYYYITLIIKYIIFINDELTLTNILQHHQLYIEELIKLFMIYDKIYYETNNKFYKNNINFKDEKKIKDVYNKLIEYYK